MAYIPVRPQLLDDDNSREALHGHVHGGLSLSAE